MHCVWTTKNIPVFNPDHSPSHLRHFVNHAARGIKLSQGQLVVILSHGKHMDV